MYTKQRTHLIEIPVGENGGRIWNTLHSEREDICEVMLKDLQEKHGAEIDASTRSWHRELLQARLRIVDQALDRLMSGSYGHCSDCGHWIGDSELELDPARSTCAWCEEQQNESRPRQSFSASIQKAGRSHGNSSSHLNLVLEGAVPHASR
jgi:RNA polymerase-binding transcription factor DksA